MYFRVKIYFLVIFKFDILKTINYLICDQTKKYWFKKELYFESYKFFNFYGFFLN